MTPRPAIRFASEAAGTAVLVGVGTGAIVAGTRLGGLPPEVLPVAWFLAVLIPIVAFIRVSGAHLNPAVTLALAASGRLAWGEVPLYVAAQVTGAFAGTILVKLCGGAGTTLGAVTLHGIGPPVGFALEFGFSLALVTAVFLLADRGEGAGRWRLGLPPAVVGLSTWLIGPLTGSGLNPARALAPAVLAVSYGNLWLYLTAPVVAGLVVASLWKPATVDRLDRGPGRAGVSR